MFDSPFAASALTSFGATTIMDWLRTRVTDLLTDEPPENGTNQYTRGFRNTKPTQDDATYALRRLKRDRPDLAQRVLAG